MLKVPYFRQEKDYTCGPASLNMVFRFFGENISEAQIAKMAKTKEDGTRHRALINAARKQGFYCFVHQNSSFNFVKHFIDMGLPVIINYIEPSEDIGHYSVIIGYHDGKFILNDPWNGKDFEISEKSLGKRWHDTHEGYKIKRWMMVLSKKKFEIGKQYAHF